MQFGVLLQVLFWDAVWGAAGGASDGAGARLTAGCCLGRSSGGAVGGAGVQSLLSGVYAGVMLFCWTTQGVFDCFRCTDGGVQAPCPLLDIYIYISMYVMVYNNG